MQPFEASGPIKTFRGKLRNTQGIATMAFGSSVVSVVVLCSLIGVHAYPDMYEAVKCAVCEVRKVGLV